MCNIFLEIDGERLEGFNTDPLDLLNMFKDPSWVRSHDDRYVYLWTCGCGEPGCAGISECKVLRRIETIVEILVPRPASYHMFADKESDGYERWKDEQTLKRYVFSLIDVKTELLRLAAELREITSKHDLYGYGFGYVKWDDSDTLIDLPGTIEHQLGSIK